MALGGVSVGWMFFADQVPDRAELCTAVLSIATDIAEGRASEDRTGTS